MRGNLARWNVQVRDFIQINFEIVGWVESLTVRVTCPPISCFIV